VPCILERVEEAIDLELLDPDVALFSASNGRFILSVATKDDEAMIEIFAGQATRIGTVTEQTHRQP